MKLIAANDDEIWMTYSGFAPYPEIGVPGTIVVDIDFTIVGGTGRFADASGGGKMTAHVQFPGISGAMAGLLDLEGQDQVLSAPSPAARTSGESHPGRSPFSAAGPYGVCCDGRPPVHDSPATACLAGLALRG